MFLPLICISHLFLLALSPRTCSHVSSARGVVDRSRRSLKMIALNGRNGDARRAITPDKLFLHKQVSLRRLTVRKTARVQHPRAKLMGKLNGRTSAPLGAATEDSKKRVNCIAHVNTSSASSQSLRSRNPCHSRGRGNRTTSGIIGTDASATLDIVGTSAAATLDIVGISAATLDIVGEPAAGKGIVSTSTATLFDVNMCCGGGVDGGRGGGVEGGRGFFNGGRHVDDDERSSTIFAGGGRHVRTEVELDSREPSCFPVSPRLSRGGPPQAESGPAGHQGGWGSGSNVVGELAFDAAASCLRRCS